MPAQTTPTGYSSPQVALHWLVFAMIAEQFQFEESISDAWNRVPVSGMVAWLGGVEAALEGHEPMMTLLMALIVLHVIGALYHHVILRDGTTARMSRAKG